MASERMFRTKVLAIQVVIVVVVLGAWELASSSSGFSAAVSSPARTASQIGHLFSTGAFRGGLASTGAEVGIAVLIGVPLSGGIGIALAHLPSRMDRTFDSLTQLGLATPQSVLLPIFMFIFGVGLLEIVIVGITHLLFVVMLNTRAAVKSVPAPLISTARFYGTKGLSLVKRVYLPYMLPSLMQAVRFGCIFAIIGVLVAQVYAGTGGGVGVLIENWSASDSTASLTAAVVILTVLTVLINQLLFMAERRFTAWQK